MRQEVRVAKPPVYDRCVAVFGADVIVDRPIIWSWGDIIYNPTDIDIPRELRAHEAVHGERQLGQVEAWWDRYLADTRFRFEEERLAHRAEWQSLVKWGEGNATRLAAIAGRLASPLYGNMIPANEAEFELLRRP